MTDAAAALLEAVPTPDQVEGTAPAAASTDTAPARKRTSGTSGAERRRRAKAEAEAANTGQPITSSGARNRATGDRAPKGAGVKVPAGLPSKAEVDKLVDALDQVLPYLALKDPYTAAVIGKRKREIAAALYQVPVLSNLVRWVARLQGGADNPYLVLLSVALPILAHHGKLPAPLGMPVQLASGLLKLEPTDAEVQAAQLAGFQALAGLTQLGDLMSAAVADADAARATPVADAA